MATLKEYLEERKMSHGKFAKIIGMSRVAVTNMCNKKQRPGYDKMAEIVLKTGGSVRFEDWAELDKN